MLKWLSTSFWDYIARLILRNRIGLLIMILLFTVFMAFQWKNMRFSFTEANLLPDDHIVNQEYNSFLEKFGEEGNLIVVGFKDSTFFTKKNVALWEEFIAEIKKDKAVELTLSIEDLKVLKKDTVNQKLQLVPFINNASLTDAYLKEKEKELFNDLPFYEGMLFNKETGSVRFAIYLDKKIVNLLVDKTPPTFELFSPLIDASSDNRNYQSIDFTGTLSDSGSGLNLESPDLNKLVIHKKDDPNDIYWSYKITFWCIFTIFYVRF